jgi:hypothetical protein
MSVLIVHSLSVRAQQPAVGEPANDDPDQLVIVIDHRQRSGPLRDEPVDQFGQRLLGSERTRCSPDGVRRGVLVVALRLAERLHSEIGGRRLG